MVHNLKLPLTEYLAAAVIASDDGVWLGKDC